MSLLNEIDGICVYDNDHLARDFDLSIEHMLTLKRLAKKLYIARKTRSSTSTGSRKICNPHHPRVDGEQQREKTKQCQLEGMKRYREKGGSWNGPGRRSTGNNTTSKNRSVFPTLRYLKFSRWIDRP
ncbi:MAG TPA: hypothetical protein VK436_03595 [Methanocella sp.]|nr:hypothetical protein [Methanocella sp.]